MLVIAGVSVQQSVLMHKDIPLNQHQLYITSLAPHKIRIVRGNYTTSQGLKRQLKWEISILTTM